METYHPPKEVEKKEDNSDLPEKEVILEKWLLEKIDFSSNHFSKITSFSGRSDLSSFSSISLGGW